MPIFTKPSVKSFLKLFNIRRFMISPDEQTIVFEVDFTGKPEIWAMDVDRRFPYQLTNEGQKSFDLRFSKDGNYLLVSFDKDGDENPQIYALPAIGGEMTPLLNQEGVKFVVQSLSEDGTHLFYRTDEDNKQYFDLCTYNFETGESKTLIRGDKGLIALREHSKDGRIMVLSEMYSNTSNLIYRYSEGEKTVIVPNPEVSHLTVSTVLLENGMIYAATDYEADHVYLASYDSVRHEFTKQVEIENESIVTLLLPKDESTIYLQTSAGVRDKCYRYDIQTKGYEEIELPVTIIDQIHLSSTGTLYVLGGTATKPSNLYKHSGGVWEQLTSIQITGVKEDDLTIPKVIHYPSTDGLEIEALFYEPTKDKDNGYTILLPHGGPQAADLLNFSAWQQIFAYEGYRVISPNYRGSTRYGSKFTKMVEAEWGDGPRYDVLSALDYLIDQGLADRKKLFVLGASYGGYMALLLHGRHEDYFKAVVDICGVSNLFSFCKSVPESWKPLMEKWVGHPVKNKEKMTADSPVTYLDRMTKPMLVVQGANDPRVVKAESDQVVDLLRKRGTEVEYLVFDDEGHGFTKLENRIVLFETILAFLERHR